MESFKIQRCSNILLYIKSSLCWNVCFVCIFTCSVFDEKQMNVYSKWIVVLVFLKNLVFNFEGTIVQGHGKI